MSGVGSLADLDGFLSEVTSGVGALDDLRSLAPSLEAAESRKLLVGDSPSLIALEEVAGLLARAGSGILEDFEDIVDHIFSLV